MKPQDWIVEEKVIKLKTFLEEAASIDTAYGKYDPTDTRQGKLHNHCGCVAYVIQKMFGGKIVSMKGHYWNKIGGFEFDATLEKLRPRYSVHRACPERKSVNPRFKKFNERVVTLLHEYPEILCEEQK
mgnify:CR=1 FL=1|jgi:hypothetical protein|tara:strand:- start:6045 stop:6428 length:384 start_codon:yes stop_codon:yes gene_type:complete